MDGIITLKHTQIRTVNVILVVYDDILWILVGYSFARQAIKNNGCIASSFKGTLFDSDFFPLICV